MSKPLYNLCFCLLLAFGARAEPFASVYGYSGLFVTPTATIMPDGQMRIGVSRMPRIDHVPMGYKERTMVFGALSYLPFMEGLLGVVSPDQHPAGMGTRTLALRMRLLRQSRLWPAIAIGAQDFVGGKALDVSIKGSQLFAATYVVLTKDEKLPGWLGRTPLTWNIGYGTDWLDANTHHLVGLWGGVSLQPMQPVRVVAEYDGRHTNLAAKLDLFSHLQVTYAWWNLRYMTWQMSLYFTL
ncbi:MAG: YjbH domain-containing protein [candidate division KSB1 bacterium]|nr:YjbH domain-containing protein [candidate division KSB1 bacterium]